ncbi:MAG: electron transfer flavoprotein subunit beta [Deltaproteobacteria bacterium]|nr:MAG: electron transfer flavoprotein subunit beta [Deltaproteobacteria bacterium]
MERIIVCIKPVPDPKQWDQVSLDPKTMTLCREGIPSIINPLDRHAVEAALRIKEDQGGEVALLSMAPPFAVSSLREMLAMGADRAALLSSPAFAGSDTLATAHILAAGVKKTGYFDLIICGDMTLDGSTAQVTSQLAEFLERPNVMHVSDLAWPAPETILLTRRIENGEVRLEARPPLVISVVKEINKPRYTSFLGIMEAENREIAVWSDKDLDLDTSLIGLEGSPTKMAGLHLRESRRAREILSGDPGELAGELARRLSRKGLI